MSDQAKPVYLDVDTGVDDALAIMLAVLHPALDVQGITTVVGNVDLVQVTRNTLQVLEIVGAGDVPVVSGAERPLVAPPRSAAMVHGADGLGNAKLPPPSRPPAGHDAVAFLRDELLAAQEPVTLIGLGPLTNFALLLQCAPQVKEKIHRLALMGGAAAVGNATAVAEFNIFHDPEAADIVFSSGLPIMMYGLDVFRCVRFQQDEVDRYFASRQDLAALPYPNTPAALAGHLFHFMIANFGLPAVPIGDAGCVGSVIDGTGLKTEKLPVYVETGGRYSRGQTIVDRRPKDMIGKHAPGQNDPYLEVGLDIDEEFYRRMFRETVGLTNKSASLEGAR
jgi:pyrimidine-specific ribonucleoside hydrolase